MTFWFYIYEDIYGKLFSIHEGREKVYDEIDSQRLRRRVTDSND